MDNLKEIMEKYNISSIDDLESILKLNQLIRDGKIVIIDAPSYNHVLSDLNGFLQLERELRYSLEGFIKAFMAGDALWAYNVETRVIGEFKVNNPFSKEIKICEPDNFPADYDKSKLN